MNNPKKTQIIDVVKSMNKEGASLNEIRENLRGMQLTTPEIEDIIQEAQVQPTTKEIHKQMERISKKIDSGKHLEPLSTKIEKQKSTIQEIHGATTATAEKLGNLEIGAEEHKQRLDSLHSYIGSLHEKHEEIKEKINDMSFVTTEIREIKDMLIEMKPLLAALKDLNEKILETNKETLMRLKK